jgi:hypothetical protein
MAPDPESAVGPHPNWVGNIPDDPPDPESAVGPHPNWVGNIPDDPPDPESAVGPHPNWVGNIPDDPPDIPPAAKTGSGIFPTTLPTCRCPTTMLSEPCRKCRKGSNIPILY